MTTLNQIKRFCSKSRKGDHSKTHSKIYARRNAVAYEQDPNNTNYKDIISKGMTPHPLADINITN